MSNSDKKTPDNAGAVYLDITADGCPLTFVRARLLLERMRAGDIAEIRLAGAEALANVPRALGMQGHTVLSLEAEDPAGSAAGPHILRVRKG